MKRLLSQSFQFTGLCDNYDMVYRWSINNAPGGEGVVPPPTEYGKSFIYPWRDEPIWIVGAELVCLPPAPGAMTRPGWPVTLGLYMPSFSFLMIGNNYCGDNMLKMDGTKYSDRVMYPAGCGFDFPASSEKTPLTYIDLHGAGSKDYMGNVMMTLFFTPKE